MDQSPNRIIGRQKTATVIFNSECPKVVDRFRARRATGVSPGVGCLTTLSVLVYEKTWRNAIWKKQKKKWFVNAAT
jgi:hypothetical protein